MMYRLENFFILLTFFFVKSSVDPAEVLLSTIDKTFDFASNALGKAVFVRKRMILFVV
jgi:hypothetical protein